MSDRKCRCGNDAVNYVEKWVSDWFKGTLRLSMMVDDLTTTLQTREAELLEMCEAVETMWPLSCFGTVPPEAYLQATGNRDKARAILATLTGKDSK